MATDRDILIRAIDKAVTNGWDWEELPAFEWIHQSVSKKEDFIEIITGNDKIYVSIIYRHDFAQALWGDDDCEITTLIDGKARVAYHTARYKFHLQQMVIADDPIIYLGQNL